MKDRGLQLTQTNNGSNVVVDLSVRNGELAVGDVGAQAQYLLLATRRGDWKENPTMGVGIEDMLNDHNLKRWRRDIIEQFHDEGLAISRLELTETKFNIQAKYN